VACKQEVDQTAGRRIISQLIIGAPAKHEGVFTPVPTSLEPPVVVVDFCITLHVVAMQHFLRCIRAKICALPTARILLHGFTWNVEHRNVMRM